MNMIQLLKLIRWRNIAFVAFVMYALRHFVARPLLAENGYALQLSDAEFSLLTIAVCCLVSAAYVINDYFDTKTDRLSGSRKVIVGKTITRRNAIILHSVFNVIAVVGACYLGWRIRCWELGVIFVLVSLVLWLHASRLKKNFIWGNVIVAFFAALVPLVAVAFELPSSSDVVCGLVLQEVYAYVVFLFLNMLVYEVNKDIFSMEGDKVQGIRTLPVAVGAATTRVVMACLVGVSVLALWVWYFVAFYPNLYVCLYFIAGLCVPYAIYLYTVFRMKARRGWQLTFARLILFLFMAFSVFDYMVTRYGNL